MKDRLKNLIERLKEEGQKNYLTDVSKVTKETISERGIKRAILALNTSGCSHRRKGAGCFHCGHIRGYEHPEEMFDRFREDVDSFKQRDEIFIYTNGSFLDETEISLELQKKILQYLKQKGFGKVVIESRPDFVDNLDNLLEVISPEKLFVGLGFDTYSDKIRELCLNKGFSREEYDKATEILGSSRVNFETRVVVKPPFLTEREGIEEAVKSVHHAFDKGSYSVSLEPVALQQHTLQDYLYQRGLYRVPWLWSIISIINLTQGRGEILFGGEMFYPLPYETGHNCEKCTQEFKQSLYEFSRSQDISILRKLDCNCRISWKNELDIETPDLYERILEVVE